MRTDVALLNFGGPQKLEEVEPFLRALFLDPDVIKLPLAKLLQAPFAHLMAIRRTPLVGPHYQSIGGSPLVKTSQEQARLLEERLGSESIKVRLAMRYTEPSIQEMVEQIANDPPERIIALALYPHFSSTTTGSSFNVLSEALHAAGLSTVPIHYIPAFFDHPLYLETMVDLIKASLSKRPHAHVLFSAHGIPASYAKIHADPYPEQIKSAVTLLADRIDCDERFSLSFQSRLGPVRWIGPASQEEIRRLAKTGVEDIVVVPISFTCEGIETLYEIDIELADIAKQAGTKLHRVDTVGIQPRFIDCLAELIRSAIKDTTSQGLGKHRCVRCLLPKPQLHRTRIECLDCGFKTPEYLLRLPSTLSNKH
jgi:ferrochelatase